MNHLRLFVFFVEMYIQLSNQWVEKEILINIFLLKEFWYYVLI